jgi:hypothetical protein
LLSGDEKKCEEKPFTGTSDPCSPSFRLFSRLWKKLSVLLGMPNCSDFVIKKEDHTIGNLVSEHLKKHENVLMAGYKGKFCRHPCSPFADMRNSLASRSP